MSGPFEIVLMERVMRVFRLLVLVTAGAPLTPVRADAHGMHAKVDVTNDPARLDAYFDENFPAEFADVTVTDADGNVVLTGKTDGRGVWTFPRPKPGTYVLTVKEPDGHVAKRKFTVAGADEQAEQTVYTGRRLNKWVGLTIGVVGLLGVSGVSWLLRRRGRRLE
jgi:nickel transport protein